MNIQPLYRRFALLSLLCTAFVQTASAEDESLPKDLDIAKEAPDLPASTELDATQGAESSAPPRETPISRTEKAYGTRVSNVMITGNKRVERDTIISYIRIQPGSHVTEEEVNQALKELFSTGFFLMSKSIWRGHPSLYRWWKTPLLIALPTRATVSSRISKLRMK